jgi:hypothetical protein
VLDVKKLPLKVVALLAIFSFLAFSGLAYLLFLQFLFPTLVPYHGAGERFTFSPGYTYQIPWHANGRLHLALQASATVKLYLDDEYVCDCTNYEFIIEPGDDVLVQMTSDSAVSGMFTAWQEIPLEQQILALTLLLAGAAGIVVAILFMRKK